VISKIQIIIGLVALLTDKQGFQVCEFGTMVLQKAPDTPQSHQGSKSDGRDCMWSAPGYSGIYDQSYLLAIIYHQQVLMLVSLQCSLYLMLDLKSSKFSAQSAHLCARNRFSAESWGSIVVLVIRHPQIWVSLMVNKSRQALFRLSLTCL